MRSTFIVSAVLAALCLSSAVKLGDESNALNTTGAFYVFADKAIHIVDPVSLKIVKNITTDQDNNPLVNQGAYGGGANTTRSWNDAVVAKDPTSGKPYLYVNEGDVYPGPAATGGPSYLNHSYVTVIDGQLQQIIARIPVNPRPVHIYVINQRNQVWTHSDVNGTFDVIPVPPPASTNGLNLTVVRAFVTRGGHGKALVDENLYPKGYASNVVQPYVIALDIVNGTRTFPLNQTAPTCTGTHSLVYNNVSRHAYFECVGGAGTLEWNTVTDTFVALHTNITGYLSATPATDLIVATDADKNEAFVFQPQGTDQPAKLLFNVSLQGVAQEPVFYSNSTNTKGDAAVTYTAFWPMSDDTNIYNRQAAAAIGADVTDSSYLEAPADCLYANRSSSNSMPLKLATAANGSALTPMCGSCAPGFSPFDASAFNGSLAGFRYANIGSLETEAQRGMEEQTMFLPAGAVSPVIGASSTANQCSFGETYRKAKRGGAYVATVATIPQPSIYVVDASAPSGPQVVGFVATNAKPTGIAWVPATAQQQAAAAGVAGSGR